MDGFGWLIKNALEATGVKIDPAEITRTIETAKVLIPRIAEDFARLEAGQKRVEEKLDRLITILNAPIPDEEIAKLLPPELTSAEMNRRETEYQNGAIRTS